jgi:hypothetical protein
MAHRLPWLVAAALTAAASLSACRPGTVSLVFRPDAGDRFTYVIDVTTVTDLRLDGEAPRRRTTHDRVEAEHTVLASGGDTARVRVTLAAPGQPRQTLLVRLDRFGQLTAIESTEGGPPGLGVPEVFPGAAGAPPAGRLAPGQTWLIDDDIRLPGSESTHVTGNGRLRSLGVEDGHRVATIASETHLPIRRATSRQRLAGEQTATSVAIIDLVDGAVRRASSVTHGRFSVTLEPPLGSDSAPVRGHLAVDVRSEVRRAG